MTNQSDTYPTAYLSRGAVTGEEIYIEHYAKRPYNVAPRTQGVRRGCALRESISCCRTYT